MDDPTLDGTDRHGSTHYDQLDELAEEFADRFRRGERPSLKEYTDRYPELAEEIRALFPALVQIERADGDLQDQAGGAGAARAPSPPDRLGDFEIVREIARGGMGV